MKTASNGRTIVEALDEVQRELDVRGRCYKRWVDEKRMSATDAKDRGERMDAAKELLQEYLDRQIPDE